MGELARYCKSGTSLCDFLTDLGLDKEDPMTQKAVTRFAVAFVTDEDVIDTMSEKAIRNYYRSFL